MGGWVGGWVQVRIKDNPTPYNKRNSLTYITVFNFEVAISWVLPKTLNQAGGGPAQLWGLGLMC